VRTVRIYRAYISILAAMALVTTPLLAANQAVMYEMKYEGGSLPLDQHDKLKLTVADDRLVIKQGKQEHPIPIAAITEVSYGNDVHRRVGAAVGVGVVTLGVGALLALTKTKKHYVGITWADPSDAAKKGGVVFKVGKGEYRGLIAALEGLTGKKAVNADISGPGGTSKS
jgi:hypothetical protein